MTQDHPGQGRDLFLESTSFERCVGVSLTHLSARTGLSQLSYVTRIMLSIGPSRDLIYIVRIPSNSDQLYVPRLQFAVCTIVYGFVEVVRAGRVCSQIVAGTMGDRRLVHMMFLILLSVVDGNCIGHDGTVNTCRSHGEVEVKSRRTEVTCG